MATSGARRSVFWSILLGVVVLDYATKLMAVSQLSRVPVPILGEWLSLRLVYNPGAAFGIYLGAHSRWIFTGLALVALVVLGEMVRKTRPHEHFRLVALAMVCGGAVGNLIDRFRSARGVVDFVDVWIGSFHWPTFNVADMAVSCGAVALAIVLWNEGRRDEATVAEQTDVAEAAS